MAFSSYRRTSRVSDRDPWRGSCPARGVPRVSGTLDSFVRRVLVFTSPLYVRTLICSYANNKRFPGDLFILLTTIRVRDVHIPSDELSVDC